MSDRLITLDAAAETLGVHYMTARKLVKSGRLPALRIGRSIRISEKKLGEWIEEQMQQGGEVVPQVEQAA